MTVFHGSSKEIEAFDLSLQLSGFYPGLYTTTDIERAKSFGNIIHTLEITGDYFLLTPELADILQKQSGHSGSGSGVVQILKDQGYSGIQRGNEFIIFDMKSVSLLRVDHP